MDKGKAGRRRSSSGEKGTEEGSSILSSTVGKREAPAATGAAAPGCEGLGSGRERRAAHNGRLWGRPASANSRPGPSCHRSRGRSSHKRPFHFFPPANTLLASLRPRDLPGWLAALLPRLPRNSTNVPFHFHLLSFGPHFPLFR